MAVAVATAQPGPVRTQAPAGSLGPWRSYFHEPQPSWAIHSCHGAGGGAGRDPLPMAPEQTGAARVTAIRYGLACTSPHMAGSCSPLAWMDGDQVWATTRVHKDTHWWPNARSHPQCTAPLPPLASCHWQLPLHIPALHLHLHVRLVGEATRTCPAHAQRLCPFHSKCTGPADRWAALTETAREPPMAQAGRRTATTEQWHHGRAGTTHDTCVGALSTGRRMHSVLGSHELANGRH